MPQGKRGRKKRVFDGSCDDNLLDTWSCPLCKSSERLLDAVEENRMDLLNNLLLFEMASPFFTTR